MLFHQTQVVQGLLWQLPRPWILPKFICVNAKRACAAFLEKVDTSAVRLEVLTVNGKCCGSLNVDGLFPPLIRISSDYSYYPIIHSFSFERNHHPHKQPNKSKYRDCRNLPSPLKLPYVCPENSGF